MKIWKVEFKIEDRNDSCNCLSKEDITIIINDIPAEMNLRKIVINNIFIEEEKT